MLKMLIAVDGSEHAQRAVETVARLAPRVGGIEAVLLNVRDYVPYYGELPPLDQDSLERLQRRRQDDLLANALDEARRLGLTQASTRGAQGAPADEIVRAADECAVDQIVLGTHGRGALGSLFLGSVAQRVVHSAMVPVLLVK